MCWPKAPIGCNKERAMRRRQLKGLVKRLKELQAMDLSRDQLLLKLGAAKAQYPAAWRLVEHSSCPKKEPVNAQTFDFQVAHGQIAGGPASGRSLPVAQQSDADRIPAKLWQFYIQLTQVEAAFKDLKDDLSLRPIFHQLEQPDRGAHLRGLPGLLPARELARAACEPWPRG